MDRRVTADASPAAETAPSKRLVLVAGSGRSGTSLVVDLLEHFGFYVPQPEIRADATNPRGFREPQWVVDFHNRMLRSIRVQPSDARPSAWFETGKFTHRLSTRNELREWLGPQFNGHDDLIVKDPRLTWFLPLWQQSAVDLGADTSVITMLRHPAEVVASKEIAYGGKAGVTSRTAGWLNLMLHTERATRDIKRVFLRYAQMLEDWTTSVAAAGDRLEQPLIQRATANTIRAAHRAVDPTLRRSPSDWDSLKVPARIRDLAEEAWAELNRLADDPSDPSAQATLDSVRTAYGQLYEEAEGVATSSIMAAGPPRGRTSEAPQAIAGARRGATDRLVDAIPHRVRTRIPAGLRARFRQYRDRTGGSAAP
jgi:hypothetical protein